MFQSDRPAILFAPVDQHDHLGLAGWKVGRRAKRDEIRADLSKRVGSAFDDQKELDLG